MLDFIYVDCEFERYKINSVSLLFISSSLLARIFWHFMYFGETEIGRGNVSTIVIGWSVCMSIFFSGLSCWK